MNQKIAFAMTCLLIIAIFVCISHAGSQTSPGCSLDMNLATQTVESGITADAGDIVSLAVIAENVNNLDTYQIELAYAPDTVRFVGGYEDVPTMGIRNLLKKNGGTSIGFQATEKRPGLLNIANTLTGTDAAEAPEGSGIIAVMRFRVLRDGPCQLGLANVRFSDSSRNEVLVTNLKGGKIN